MTRVAFITGITGQDGSYLSEILLEKGYIVWGMMRRASYPNTCRIDHIINRLILRYGDMTDGQSMFNILNEIKNNYKDLDRLEIYNLAAQSHVKISFDNPVYTGNTDAMGVLSLLECVRNLQIDNKIRFYQASTSELYGKVLQVPQSETTPFNPQSPYGVAKQFAYWTVKLYREAYKLNASNGILFNHETVASFLPMIFTNDKKTIDIKPINEIVNFHTNKNSLIVDEKKEIYQEGKVSDELYVWDKEGWTKVKHASGYKHDNIKNPKKPKFINSKNALYLATGTHKIIMADNSEKNLENIIIGDKVKVSDFPPSCINNKDNITDYEAEFIGLIVGDGDINKSNHIRFGNSSQELRNYITELWKKICKKNNKEYIIPTYYPEKSGFNPNKIVGRLSFLGTWFLKRTDVYNIDKTKRIPQYILNSSVENKLAFLKGYNKADGLKKNLCIYEFKNFKTNSAVLACGLIYLLSCTTKQKYNITLEEKLYKYKENEEIKKFYYSINILSNSRFSSTNLFEKQKIIQQNITDGISQREISRTTGVNRKTIKNIRDGHIYDGIDSKEIVNNSVKKIIEYYDYDGWFYDLETESGTFMCGVGQGIVHNSPVREETFITRKITMGLKRILNDPNFVLTMGNLNARRDWGHAKDYCMGMWQILQQDEPDDFVLATGEYHSVREFAEKAFASRGIIIKWQGSGLDEVGYDSLTARKLICVDKKYFRPAEVEELLGDPTKAKDKLGWVANTSFDDLIKEMVESDCQ
jgi:GDPmannose 4,6-dehydratase